MNENIDLIQILKDAPKGTKLYSSVYGEVELTEIDKRFTYCISTLASDHTRRTFTKQGLLCDEYDNTECVLFPSKDQRDWSKFKADLPIDTLVAVANCLIDWRIRYYAGDNKCWAGGYKSDRPYKPDIIVNWKYIIPFDKFNPNNIEESLKYNIVK